MKRTGNQKTSYQIYEEIREERNDEWQIQLLFDRSISPSTIDWINQLVSECIWICIFLSVYLYLICYETVCDLYVICNEIVICMWFLLVQLLYVSIHTDFLWIASGFKGRPKLSVVTHCFPWTSCSLSTSALHHRSYLFKNKKFPQPTRVSRWHRGPYLSLKQLDLVLHKAGVPRRLPCV